MAGCLMDSGCTLQQSREQQTAKHPPTVSPLPGSEKMVPYQVEADEALPLKPYIRKPHSSQGHSEEQRLFNCRLSRVRRVIENAFGILTKRWHVLFTTINQQPQVDESIVLALREEHSSVYEVPDTTPDCWREDPSLWQAALPGSTNPTHQAKMIREFLTEYLNSDNVNV